MQEKLIESNYILANDIFTIDTVKEILISKFQAIDFEQAKQDVIPFLKDTSQLDIWSADFFIQITKQLQTL